MPSPDGPVSFDAHIKPLFRQKDRQSMSFAFRPVVRRRRPDTRTFLECLRDGWMPCGGAWPGDRMAVFQRLDRIRLAEVAPLPPACMLACIGAVEEDRPAGGGTAAWLWGG